MKTSIFIIFMSFISTLMFAFVPYACPYLMFNQSVVNASFGLEGGVADIRHNDASGFVINPAKVVFANGLRVSYSASNYYRSDYINSRAAIGFDWGGISFPMINHNSEFGYIVEHLKQKRVDENGTVLGTFTPEEQSLDFNCAINLSDLLRTQGVSVSEGLVSSLGFGISFINSDLYKKKSGDGEETIFHSGLLAGYKKSNFRAGQDLSLVVALAVYNLTEEDIYYVNDITKDLLPHSKRLGLSLNYTFKREWAKAYNCDFLNFNFSDEFLNLYSSFDLALYSYDRTVISSGLEVTTYNLLSARMGYSHYSDLEAGILTYGAGLNLPLTKKFSISGNYLDKLSGDVYYKSRWEASAAYNL